MAAAILRIRTSSTGTAASQGFRAAHSFETRRVAADVPHRYATRSLVLRHLALEVGEDGRDILADLGYSPSETEASIENKVIFAPS